jgi:RHS repeat-associated protein
MITDWHGNVKSSSDFYPGVYPERRRRGGEPFDVAQGREPVERRVITSSVPNNYKFTGLERDSESGLDHTLFRQYSSILGRWQTPDLWDGDINNPQSLNRYAYVLNNPTTLTDPLGLSAWSNCYWDTSTEPAKWVCPTMTGGGFGGGSGSGPCSLIRYAFAHPMVSNCPPGGGGGGAPLVHVWNLHKAGRDINTIKTRLEEVLQCIDPKCLAFLQSGGGNLDSFVSDLLSNNLLAAGDFTPNIAAFTNTYGTDVPPGYAAMVINDNGAFFNNAYSVDEGNLVGDTPRAQAFILLHELAHALNAKGFQNDLNNTKAGQANDKLIESNCQTTLKQFSSSP